MKHREVLVYYHFAGDNSCLNFIIKFERKKYVFYRYLMQLFSAAIFFKKLKKKLDQKS